MDTPIVPELAGDTVTSVPAAAPSHHDNPHDSSAALQQKRMVQAGMVMEHEIEQLQEELKSERDESNRLRAARSALTARLAQTESRLAAAEKQLAALPTGSGRSAAEEELQHRYEKATEELKQARNKNAELQQEISRARATAAKLVQQARKSGELDWEAEKLRIIAALEAEGEPQDEAQKTERMGIVEVLQITDEVIASKDHEIQELKKHAEPHEQRESVESRTSVSVAEVLDNNALIQEERERLQRLQEEWHAKLRHAEVEVALERAKITHQRIELEELLRAARPASSAEPPKSTETAEQSPQPASGRWLARLGLTPADRTLPRHF
jgi:hypothetical protein